MLPISAGVEPATSWSPVRRRIQLSNRDRYRYMIHLYCLAVQAGFYSDVVECRTLSPADRVRSPVWENVVSIFSFVTFFLCPFLSFRDLVLWMFFLSFPIYKFLSLLYHHNCAHFLIYQNLYICLHSNFSFLGLADSSLLSYCNMDPAG